MRTDAVELLVSYGDGTLTSLGTDVDSFRVGDRFMSPDLHECSACWARSDVTRSGRITDACRGGDRGHQEVVAEDVDAGFRVWNRSGLLSDLWTAWFRPSPLDDTILFTRTTDDRTEVWRVVP